MLIHNTQVLLKRGTAEQHVDYDNTLKKGNFTLVEDKPELRFHDGTTLGGAIIPIPENIYRDIIEFYETYNNK